jgi:hypothetical protein
MSDLEQKLRAAMRAPMDGEEVAPDALIAAVKRRHRRHNAVRAGLAVLIAAAVAVPLAIAVRSVTSQAPATTRARHLPTGLRGLPLPAGISVQFLTPTSPMSEGQPAWYSTATGTEKRISGLPLQTQGFFVYGRVQGGTWESGGCIRYRCYAPHEYYFIADGSHTATPIGTGIANWGLVPSSGARVWLLSYPHYWDNPARTSATVRLVSTSGRGLGQHYLLPAGYWLQAAVGRYLLLRNLERLPSEHAPDAFVLWDPSARRVVRNIDNPIAVSQDQIAWTDGCRGCHVQLLNVATGKTVSTSLPAGPQPHSSHLTTVWGLGSFSDNGQLLVYETFGGTVDIVSAKTGMLLLGIPTVGAGEQSAAGWLDGGPVLMVAAGPRFGTRGTPRPPAQIGIWQPGDTNLRVATIKNAAEIRALGQRIDALRWDGYGVISLGGL